MGRWQPQLYPGTFLRRRALSHALFLDYRLAETKTNLGVEQPQNAQNFPSDSHNQEGLSAVHSTTAMTDDAVKVTSVQPNMKSLSEAYLKLSQTKQSDSIIQFLQKPQVVAKGSFSVTDTTTVFPPYPMPGTLLAKKIYADKVRGYFGLRATLVFTLQVNAERFQQGRYMLTWVPTGGARYGINGSGLAWVNAHSSSLTQRTQLPRVELDLNCDTSAELRIPFSSSLDYYPLASMADPSRFGNLGILRIYPYQALESVSGPTNCTYTLWGHMEDVELIGAAMPQDAQFQGRGISSSVKKKNSTSYEAQAAGVGPVSSLAFKISKAASYFNPVPVLGNYSGPLSWASDIVGNAASVFGWSAPVHMGAATQVVRRNIPYATNVNKVDNSAPLSLDVQNQVDVMPGFGGTNTDELDIAYMAGIPFYNYSFLFPNTLPPGANLITWNVCPMDSIKSRTTNNLFVWDMGPCQYLANKFSYWRGTMVYKFKLVKTEFHSGRLAITFTPFEQKSIPIGYNALGVDFVHRDIIDIREHSEFELRVPFISTTPYKSTSVMTDNFSIGIMSVDVLDSLIAPDTVNSQIRIFVEMSMGPDAEFAGVPEAIFAPAYSVEFQANSLSQSQVCSIVSKNIGSMETQTFQLDTSKAAIGERVLNLRSLLKKFHPLVNVASFGSGVYLNMLPYATPWTTLVTSTNIVDTYPDLYGELSSFFMYSRGGVRLKFVDVANVKDILAFVEPIRSPSTITKVIAAGSSSYSNTLGPLEWLCAKSNYAILNSRENFTEVQIPQYSYFHSRNNSEEAVNGSDFGRGNMNDTISSPFVVSFTEAKQDPAARATLSGSILRAGADDCNMSFFVSIPPMKPI